MHNYITGIQQIGIGVSDAQEAMNDYKKLFGMDVLIFDDVAEAKLMTQYTGGKIFKRRAILSLNMTGGGGFEIWQFLNRKAAANQQGIKYGDLGIFAPKIKCRNIEKAYAFYETQPDVELSSLSSAKQLQKEIDYTDKAENKSTYDNLNETSNFWVKDKHGNHFQLVEALDYFDDNERPTGGVSGAVIGVSNMEASIKFYSCLLGSFEIIYDREEKVQQLTDEQSSRYRKVLLRKKVANFGAFGKLLGGIDIELVQALDCSPAKIYANRYWGDIGFIHLCLDVVDMEGLKEYVQQNNYPFTVDSNESYAMEASAGRFCYLEDPDGALIELVETHKVPILKKYGLFFNLKKRGLRKPLPKWMIKMLSVSKVK